MRLRVVVVTVTLLALLPQVLSAQQTAGVIAGQVRDETGGVLPGVTVEVASPALIEKARTVVTGDDGQYRIVELRPGTYTVTFTLAGFGKVVREGVELTTGFTATVNADLKVGDLSETITVSGASPVVDLQNVTQQAVLSRTVLDAIPTGRSFATIGKLIPGIDALGNTGGVDVGGTTGRDTKSLMIHGGSSTDFKVMIDGLPQSTFIDGGGDNIGVPPADSLTEEFNLQYSALPAEVETGGVLLNMVPKTGGNAFRASFFGNFATGAMQADNLTADLRARGLASSTPIDYMMDVNPSFGGPLRRDRLWFFVTYRDFRFFRFSIVHPDVDPTDWVYTPDTSKPLALEGKPQKTVDSRVTWQVSPRNRLSLGFQLGRLEQHNDRIGGVGNQLRVPEATPFGVIRNKPVAQLSWTAPLTNRLLMEAGGQIYRGQWRARQQDFSVSPAARELSSGVQFRAVPNLGITGSGYTNSSHEFLRGAVSYTTGAHAIKVGATLWTGRKEVVLDGEGRLDPYLLLLLNGRPNAVEYRIDPLFSDTRLFKIGVFAQDQWTVRRLTVNYGARIDTIDSGFPAQHEPATAYFPARDFAEGDVLRWRDLSPRLGVAYDLFGTGRTAVKASVSRYVAGELHKTTEPVNPANASGGTLQRAWNDANGDYVPQGDPTNPLPNGELGPSPNARWGQPRFTLRYDPEWAQGGWGVRGYNWEYSASVQQELRSNVSLNVGYFHRTYGNFPITDNAAVTASDFDTFCITGPRDPRLPGGGGDRLCGLYDVKPAAVSRLDNVTTRDDNYGEIQQNYHGVDVGLNLRLPNALLQGGYSVGRELYDICGVIATLPEILISGSTKVPADYCHQQQPLMHQVKFLGSYQLPWAMNIAATYQNAVNAMAPINLSQGQVRMGIQANYVATNAVIAPELGRNLAAGANATASVNLVEPGRFWWDRVQQLDVRLSRTFRAGPASIKGMVDLYNLMNANTMTISNFTYGTTGAAWLTPLAIIPGRMLKFGVQLDY